MTSEDKSKRIEEVKRGTLAKNAYDSYLKDFIDEQMQALYDGFVQVADLTEDKIFNIRQIHLTLSALQKKIDSDINTGMMASKQLEEMNNE